MKATLESANSIVPAHGEGERVEAKNIILATGSLTGPLPGVQVAFDEKTIVTSTGALSLPQVPKRFIIVGGGAIGLEFASIYSRLGSQVTVIEFLDQVANGFDKDVAQVLMKGLIKLGVKFHLSSRVTSVKSKPGEGVSVSFGSLNKQGPPTTLEGDVCLISTGRIPNSKGIGLEKLNIKTDKIGRVIVDEEFSTNVPSIKAIGDLIPGPMLAHKAEADGCAAVAAVLGKKFNGPDYDSVPAVIYTHPEAAIVGATEAKLKKEGTKYRKGQSSLMANARARVNADTDGFVKVLVEPDTGKILGATVVADAAGDLIQELVLAKAHGLTAQQVGDTIHPHPCVSEAVKEACHMASGH
eukprot:Protomagalhaensia_sp_Gyna_25__4961@NODE_539_length_3175_cov_91_364158_g422_i0_p1_GENE_NODE_539_length_3175_cov_91_364158_g422_i0NODE_539_length_3175_cov_91_364158_g422_i0_p1_ORF_typecomplete_len355_score65_14Pyr_redox_2/PF07992_14/1_4e40Pyr_redox_2/PF07992_14/2_9e02Pyr_redox_dim/PF02852_22/6_5e34Pyr_redox/PF00070_27/6_2e22HI0933_like/PF03486_14/29HI0933_like/PF03486_14/0_93HI0933_like/PF03486_14/0_0031Pyr_redox_3/PF13738_6/6e06Pyr_redox_3/PF13738_6/95K_oxygenase/PF13434_6/3_5e05K_oxygenase/PF134